MPGSIPSAANSRFIEETVPGRETCSTERASPEASRFSASSGNVFTIAVLPQAGDRSGRQFR
jgi:hypothetical protein